MKKSSSSVPLLVLMMLLVAACKKNPPDTQHANPTGLGMSLGSSGTLSWTAEPVVEPVLAETLLHGATVQTYDINGNTPEQLEASLAASGPGSRGFEAKTSYQLVLYKGNPSDGACGFSTARVEPAVTVLVPRWVVMPNVTDTAKQWWSWQIKRLAHQEQLRIDQAFEEARQATTELNSANCASGPAAYAEINDRLKQAHVPAVFPEEGSDVEFHSPGAVVEATTTLPLMAEANSQTKTNYPKAPPEMYALNLKTLEGNSVSMESLRGRPIFLNFWATWCGPCRAEIPSMVNLINQLKGHNVFFACVTLEEATAVQAFLARTHTEIPVFLADSKGLQFESGGIPTTYILTKSGEIALHRLGGAKWDAPDIVKLLTDLEQK